MERATRIFPATVLTRGSALRAALCAGLAGLGTPAAAQQSGRVPLVVAPTSTTGVVSLYYAAQQHLFERAGLDVTIVPAAGGATSVTAVVGGAAQIGFTNTLQLVTAHAKGIPLTLVAAGTQWDPAHPFTLMLVRGDSPLRGPKDLENHVVAVTALHDLSTISVILLLQKNGVDPARVKFTEMPPEAMAAALAAGRVDAFVAYEPFVSAALAGGARALASPMDAVGSNVLTGAWFASLPWASAHRDAVLRFARVISQASVYADDHYDDLIPLISSYSKIPVETLQRMTFSKIAPSLSAASLQSLVDAAAATHEIAAKFPAKDLIFPGVP